MFGELEEDHRAMVGSFVEVCRRRGLKVNAGNSKVIELNGEEGCLGHSLGDEALTLMRYYSWGLLLLYETLKGGS